MPCGRGLDHGRLQAHRRPVPAGQDRGGQGAAGPVRRGGLVGGGGPAGRGGGGAAHLRVCGPRPHAEKRGGRGGGRVLPMGHEFRARGRIPALPVPAGRSGGAGAQAQDHRRGVHPGV